MIDEILPCPQCGEYPDFSAHYEKGNHYSISSNCYCEDTDEFIDGSNEAAKDLISAIQAWNAFAEAPQTIKVLKSHLEQWKFMLARRANPPDDMGNALVKIKKYLGEIVDD